MAYNRGSGTTFPLTKAGESEYDAKKRWSEYFPAMSIQMLRREVRQGHAQAEDFRRVADAREWMKENGYQANYGSSSTRTPSPRITRTPTIPKGIWGPTGVPQRLPSSPGYAQSKAYQNAWSPPIGRQRTPTQRPTPRTPSRTQSSRRPTAPQGVWTPFGKPATPHYTQTPTYRHAWPPPTSSQGYWTPRPTSRQKPRTSSQDEDSEPFLQNPDRLPGETEYAMNERWSQEFGDLTDAQLEVKARTKPHVLDYKRCLQARQWLTDYNARTRRFFEDEWGDDEPYQRPPGNWEQFETSSSSTPSRPPPIPPRTSGAAKLLRNPTKLPGESEGDTNRRWANLFSSMNDEELRVRARSSDPLAEDYERALHARKWMKANSQSRSEDRSRARDRNTRSSSTGTQTDPARYNMNREPGEDIAQMYWRQANWFPDLSDDELFTRGQDSNEQNCYAYHQSWYARQQLNRMRTKNRFNQ